MEPLELRSVSPIAPTNLTGFYERAVIEPRGPVLTPTATPTPEETPTATPMPTPSMGEVMIEQIHADAAGNDNENLTDEYVVFENAGPGPLDLSGWTVHDSAGRTYRFPSGFGLAPGEQVTLYSGNGTDTATELYSGAERAIWNNGGDTIILRDDTGQIVLEVSY